MKMLNQDDLWRVKDVCTFLNISRTTFYRYRKQQEFPSGIQLSSKTIVWTPKSIMDWVESRPENK